MKLVMKLAGAISALFIVSAVNAQETTEAYSWTGGYVGVFGSADGYSTEVSDYWCWSACDAPDTAELSVGAGATLGYNYQVSSNFLIGVEAEVASGKSTETVAYDHLDADVWYWNSDVDRAVSVRGRAGIVMDRTMAFVSGGVTSASVTHSMYNDSDSEGRDTRATWNGNQNGVSAGFGVEHALNDNLRVKFEYVATIFDGVDACIQEEFENYACSDGDLPNSDDSIFWSNANQSIRVGVNYAF